MTQALEIVMTDGECLMDSRVLAARLGYEHETVVRNITRHKARLEAKSVVRQGVGKPPKGSLGGRPEVSYLLDERQCLILAGSLKKGVEADEWHDRLVDEFLQARLRIKQLEAGQQRPHFALSEALRLRAMENLQRVPDGYFCVQAELFKHLYNLERLLDASLDGQAQIEESVGHLWSRHMREVLHLPESARCKYAHVCQDGRVVQAWAYPIQYVNVFMVWLWEDYFPKHLSAYQQYPVRGSDPPDNKRHAQHFTRKALVLGGRYIHTFVPRKSSENLPRHQKPLFTEEILCPNHSVEPVPRPLPV